MMENQSITTNGSLSAVLKENEQVLWRGKSEPFKLFDGPEGKKIALRMILTAVIIPLVLLAHILFSADTKMVVVAFLVVVMAVVLLLPVAAHSSLLGQTYYITTRRILIMRKNELVGNMYLRDADTVETYAMYPGVDSLAIGSAIKGEADHQLRWRALHPKEAPGAQTASSAHIGVVFYNISDAAGALDALNSVRNSAAA